jgi:hypothetical protein
MTKEDLGPHWNFFISNPHTKPTSRQVIRGEIGKKVKRRNNHNSK